jgi:organic radical activating enzyme
MATERVGQPYEIRHSKIYSPRCEINLTSHCNLACRGCSHLSPVMPRSFADPAVVEHDLSRLARHYRVQTVRLLGGEPLLHPGLLEIVAAVRASSIAERICVVTNGVLLGRMPVEFWQQVDKVSISVYPGREPPPDQLQQFRQQADSYGTVLELNPFDRFRVPYAEDGTSDLPLVRRIYQTCKVAHVWRCHTVQSGYFYKCPQSVLLPQVLGRERGFDPITLDGIEIVDSPSFGSQLLAYLQSEEPLQSCRNCLGTVGNVFPHEQLARRSWREPQAGPTEALINLEYLRHLEAEPSAPDLWRTPPGQPLSGRFVRLGQKFARARSALARVVRRASRSVSR